MLPDFPSTEIINDVGGTIGSSNRSCISGINLEDAKKICNNSNTCYGFWTSELSSGSNDETGRVCLKYGYGDPKWADDKVSRATRNGSYFYKKQKFTTPNSEFNIDSQNVANKFNLCLCNPEKCPSEPDINTTDILDLPLTRMNNVQSNALQYV